MYGNRRLPRTGGYHGWAREGEREREREHGMAEKATFTSYSEEIRYENNRRKGKMWGEGAKRFPRRCQGGRSLHRTLPPATSRRKRSRSRSGSRRGRDQRSDGTRKRATDAGIRPCSAAPSCAVALLRSSKVHDPLVCQQGPDCRRLLVSRTHMIHTLKYHQLYPKQISGCAAIRWP